jgi:hypothetical protein
LEIQERKWKKKEVLECNYKEEKKVEREVGLTIEKQNEIGHSLIFGECCLKGFVN